MKPPGAASDFFRNDIKEKSELFPADARPKAALQPQSHDCHRIKGNLYLTLLQKAPQKAHSRFILPLQYMFGNQTYGDAPTAQYTKYSVIPVCLVASVQTADTVHHNKHYLNTNTAAAFDPVLVSYCQFKHGCVVSVTQDSTSWMELIGANS